MIQERIVSDHLVSSKIIKVDKTKIEVLEKLEFLTVIKDLRSFFGHYGFYQCFIESFSQIAKVLINLLVKDLDFIFTEECAKIFNELKKMLT
jgi:hypothetical protein